jgi:adenylate cyclase
VVGALSPAADVEARLLGQHPSMRPCDVSAKASVSLRSVRRFWRALGFANVEDEDIIFTEADLMAMQTMAGLVRDGVMDEPTALAMARAFARTTDLLAVTQTQLMAEAMGEPSLVAGTAEKTGIAEKTGTAEADADVDTARAVPDLATARAVAVKLADIADDLEPLLVHCWRRHLSAAISRMVSESESESAPTESGGAT